MAPGDPHPPPGPLGEVAALLAAAGCVAPLEEARELVAAAPDPTTLRRWASERAGGVPLPWLTGWTTFAGLRIRVAVGVYVPRPQTEALARRAVARLPQGGCAADLCTGCGAVAVALRRSDPSASVVGVDLDPAAVRCALGNGVPAVRADVAAGLPFAPHRLDLVTAVAPYVPTGALPLLPRDVLDHEPVPAFDGGGDGLELVRRVVAQAADALRPGGWLLVELGGAQDRLLGDHLVVAGFSGARPWYDEEGDLRGVEARLDG